ncbi:ABC transporter substrate-binding protein [Solidesulfovibrio sp.]|uniref:ABC transporter substrate-binding protein n=1 Tax=Solidesulfovibrio sp. TaxID=2910990 RepID=UPI0026387A32|nr:ABC transporter substrate-binding protein [Solidesulfovibrio sp.]
MAGRLRALLWVVVAASLVAARPAPAGDAPPIRLGMSAGFTGSTREMAVELYRGALAMFARQNRQGGLAGRPIELLAADDGYEPDPAIENSVRFLDEGVLALFSSLGTPTVSRVLPVLRGRAAREARLFFPVTGLEALRTPPYVRYVYNLRASYRQEIEALVDAFSRRGAARVAICHQADAFGRSGWDGAGLALARRGRALCGEATFPRLAGAGYDMTPQVRVLAASRPEAVLLIGAAPACAAFIRDLRRQGMAVPVGVVSFAGGEILLRELAALGEPLGLALDDGLILSQVTPPWRDDALPAAVDYRRDLAALGQAPAPPGGWPARLPEGSAVGFEGYLNARLMIAVLRAMPDPDDRRGLDAAARAASPADIGLGASVFLDGPAHQALRAVYLFTAARGALAPLETVSAADGD